jgi:hypothetical protein
MESSPNESKEKIKPWEKRREREGSDRKIAALENRKSKERRQQKHEKERRIQIKK